MTVRPQELARTVTNALNPFFIFTALYALVALIWLIPDKRIERVLAAQQPAES